MPKGATLTDQQVGGDRVDPSERYSIGASSNEIRAFFDEAMPNAGWKKGGNSTEGMLFYRKKPHLITVIIDRDGGAFRLMGS